MKKSTALYFLADFVTLSGIVSIAAILCLAFSKYQIYDDVWVLAFFVIGELRDAIDGPIARLARQYELEEDPESPKPNRQFWVIADQVVDILLGLSVMAFVWLKIDPIFVAPILFAGGPLALIVQIVRRYNLRKNLQPDGLSYLDDWVERLVLIRRWGYLIVIAFELMVLLTFSFLPVLIKAILFVLGVIVGAVLCVMKANRLSEDKTPIQR